MTVCDDVRIVDSFDDGGKVLRRAPMVGAVVGLLCAVVLVVLGGTNGWWSAPAVAAGGTAAGHDIRSGRLPDHRVAGTAVLGMTAAVVLAGGPGGVLSFLTGALALAAPLLVFHLASPCSMAFGDVKFAAAFGGLLGIVGTDSADRLFLAMTALTVAAGVAVLGALAVRSREVPFGPSLFLGTCVTLVFAVATRSPFA